MQKEINLEHLEVMMALQTLDKYRSKINSSEQFEKDIGKLVDTLLEIGNSTHFCPNCKAKIDFYVYTK